MTTSFFLESRFAQRLIDDQGQRSVPGRSGCKTQGCSVTNSVIVLHLASRSGWARIRSFGSVDICITVGQNVALAYIIH